MSDKTHIEWTEATWNPVTGCTKVSAGCKHCYAERDWARLSANKATRYFGREFTDVQCHVDVLDLPLRWKRPRRIFVNSMSDLFHPDVAAQFIADVFGIMASTPQHTFQILTKRPKRAWLLLGDGLVNESFKEAVETCMALYTDQDLAWPLPNVWLGVSVEDQETANERIPLLLQTPAAVRWISAEPLLGAVDLLPWLDPSGACCMKEMAACHDCPAVQAGQYLGGIDWLVAGGESGPKARPSHPEWFCRLRDQCAAAGVPFLFKQWGEWVPSDQCDATSGDALYTDGGKDLAYPHLALGFDGQAHTDAALAGSEPQQVLYRAGKRAAGRLLDGVLHDSYPGI